MNKLTLLFCSLFLVSCMYKYMGPLRPNIKSEFSKEIVQGILDGLYKGYAKLETCTYLKNTYPKEYDRLLKIKNDMLIYSHKALPKEEQGTTYCAKGALGGLRIWINDDIKWGPGEGCTFNRTMPHEILHLLGFSHPENNYEKTKEFYNILRQCGI